MYLAAIYHDRLLHEHQVDDNRLMSRESRLYLIVGLDESYPDSVGERGVQIYLDPPLDCPKRRRRTRAVYRKRPPKITSQSRLGSEPT